MEILYAYLIRNKELGKYYKIHDNNRRHRRIYGNNGGYISIYSNSKSI